MNGYELKIVRYGEERSGECAAIYVTEPFSISKRVKLNEPSLDSADAVEVLKLNLVIDFQTGLYDYNTMTSIFSRTNNFEALKTSFSSAEWCGHVYTEQNFGNGRVTEDQRSYFEDESGSREFEKPAGGIPEENLFIILRGLNEPFLRAGENRTLPILPSNLVQRLLHLKSEWREAVISRAEQNASVTVPAGKFPAELYEVRVSDGRVGRFWIESNYPRRLLKWSWNHEQFAPRGKKGGREAEFSGELLRSERLDYWNLKSEGDEALRAKMGLR